MTTANYYQFIHGQLLENADREVLAWPESGGGRTYVTTDILNRVAAIRAKLTRQCVQPGDQVLLAIPVSFDLICSLLAIMAAGAIPVLPPAAASGRVLVALVHRDAIRTVITRRALPGWVRWAARGFGVTLLTVDSTPVTGPYLPPQPVDPNQPALISHSSGSTGLPKAIRRSHRVLTAQHLALSQSFPPWSGQRDFPLFPNILLHNLATGTMSVLPDLPGFSLAKINPKQVVQQLVDQQVNTLTGNVYYFRRLLRYLANYPQSFPQVQAVGVGGSPVPEGLVQALKTIFSAADIYIIYGSSEAEPIAIRKVGSDAVDLSAGYVVGAVHSAIQVRFRPVGTLTFMDGRTQPVGEIEVRGAHVAVENDAWLPTGDYGYLTDSQQLVLTARAGNEQISNGVQHYQIEQILSDIAGIDRVAARATDGGFIIFVEGNAPETEIRQVLSAQFPVGLCPRIEYRKKLPVDARHLSKIRYDQLT